VVRPEALGEFLLGNDAVAVLEQIEEHVEHFRPQVEEVTGTRQRIEVGVEDTVAKGVEHRALPLGI
jgi:hypothetical protein